MAEARILIVEDEQIVGRDIQAMLQSLGYVAELAGSAEDALVQLAAAQPDLVLMDIVLKGSMDGIELAAVARDRFRLPVIYLTAHADEATVQRAKLTTPYGYILKPFEERELYIAIELALSRHRSEKKRKQREKEKAEKHPDEVGRLQPTDAA